MDLHGVGPAGAAGILAGVGDVTRFADRNRFASWTAPRPSMRPPENRTGTSSPEPGTGA